MVIVIFHRWNTSSSLRGYTVALVIASPLISHASKKEDKIRRPNNGQNPCEVNWLDPQPDRESSDYEEYIVQLEKIQEEIGVYRGFHQPPTEEEYIRLIQG